MGPQEFIYSAGFVLGSKIQRLKKQSPYPQMTHSIMKKNMTNKLLVKLASSAINIYKGKVMVKCLTWCNKVLSSSLRIIQRRKISFSYTKNVEDIKCRELCLDYHRLTKVK